MKIIKAIIWVGISFSILLPPTHAEEEISGLSSIEATYRASVDVRGTRRKDKYVFGFVFEDSNRDGVYQRWEKGIRGVSVSNGQNVVLTNNHGRYRLLNIYDHGKNPTKPGAMTIFVTKPAEYKVPVDKDNVPQFYYHHIPDGSPEGVHGKPFRFEGLPASGPLPDLINFPIIRTQKKKRFKILVSGDTQTYSNDEVGYVRDTLAREWSALKDMEALIIQGDVLGDDLSLFPRFKQALSLARTTQYYVPGNHDADFDAPTNSNSFDTFKREWGPAYYSFDIGDVHFVVMNDIFYPCTEQDNEDGLHDECEGETTTASYNGIITNDQMQWLANDLALVPKRKLIVLNMHISIYSFLNQNFARDMVDNQVELIETLGCIRATDGTFPPEDCARPILALSGHTHTLEQIRPGEVFEGWETTLNSSTTVPPGRSAGPSPFPQIVTGAACGAWWSGDFNSGVVPEAWQISGAPRGYLVFEFDGSTYMDIFKATGQAATKQMSIELLTPEFNQWFQILAAWYQDNPRSRAVPPVNINDLPDTKQVSLDELGKTTLSVNVWNGSRDSIIEVSIDGGTSLSLTRTQPGEGENILETLDPFALKRQMMVARYAYVNESEPQANGFELFRGTQQCFNGGGPCTPRPSDDFFWTDQSSHIWQISLPEDLAEGIHVAKVTFTDHFDRTFNEDFAFEVVEERASPTFWNEQNFEQLP